MRELARFEELEPGPCPARPPSRLSSRQTQHWHCENLRVIATDRITGSTLHHATRPHNDPLKLTDLKLLNVPLSLLFNFHVIKLAHGISRLSLPGANQP
jgi:hypothetical protein